MDKKQYAEWFHVMDTFAIPPTKEWYNDPVWTKDPKCTVFRDTIKDARVIGYAGPPGKKATEVLAKYIVVDMFVRAIQGFLLRKAGHLTTVSKEIESILINIHHIDRTKISIIPNGYDEDTVMRLSGEVRKDYPRRIVFVGSLRPFKDPLTLLEGFRIISAKYPEAELVIVGQSIDIPCAHSHVIFIVRMSIMVDQMDTAVNPVDYFFFWPPCTLPGGPQAPGRTGGEA
jgi:glycosyltransferase involved in cell wall biosynthesis